MMVKHIAIVSAGGLPVPAVRGGAVESLIDYIIKENEYESKINITVFSIFNKDAFILSQKYKNCDFKYVQINEKLKVIYQISARIINKLFNKKMDLNKLYIDKVCELVGKDNFDHVIVENRVDYILPLKKISGTTVSLHIHNDYLNSTSDKCHQIIEGCHKIITVSEYIRKRVLTIDEKYNAKVQVLKNCTDSNIFNKKIYGEFRNEFRVEKNISDDDIVIMFSGRIHPTKGIKELISAFSDIKRDNCKLLIVGSSWYGKEDKTTFAKELEKLSEGIKDKIIFTGFIPFDEMPKIYGVADIVVVPSIWDDPAPLVVFESMASELPLITTNSGGIPEYINKECSIMLERNGDLIGNLTSSMESLIDSKNKREAMGSAGRKHSLQYSRKKYYRDFIGIIEDDHAN